MKNTEQNEYKQVRQVSCSAEVQQERRNTRGGILSGEMLGISPLFVSNSIMPEKLALEAEDGVSNGSCSASRFNTALYVAHTTAPVKKQAKKRKTKDIRSNFEKFSSLKRYNIRFADAIQSFKPEMAENIRHCGDTMVELEHGDGTSRILVEFRCCKRFCGICSHRRSQALVHRYSSKIGQYIQGKHAYHIVFTYKNMDKLLSRKLIAKHLRNVFKRKIWDKYSNKSLTRKDAVHIDGGAYSVENTYNYETDEFHPHVHSLVVLDKPLPTYYDAKKKKRFVSIKNFKDELQNVWREITDNGTDGENYIVYVEEWRSNSVMELLKYATKLEKNIEGEEKMLPDMPQHRLDELIEWTVGRRQVSAIGGLYNYSIGVEREVENEIAREMTGDVFEKTDHVRIERKFDHSTGRYIETARLTVKYKAPDELPPETIPAAKEKKLLQRLDSLAIRISRRQARLIERSEWYISTTGTLTIGDEQRTEEKKLVYSINSLKKKQHLTEVALNT